MALYRANIRWLAVANAVVGIVPCILSIDVASMARAADLSALDLLVRTTIGQTFGSSDPRCNAVDCLVQLAEYFANDYLDFPDRIVGFQELVGNNHLVDNIYGIYGHLSGVLCPAAAVSENEADSVRVQWAHVMAHVACVGLVLDPCRVVGFRIFLAPDSRGREHLF